jgi:hypothetical protein
LQEIVRDELDKGVIAAYGRRNLYTHFQKLGVRRDVVILRGELFKVVKEQDPRGVERRRRERVNRRRAFRVPGPNWLWSIDAHCKLEHFGIQIYAGIDAYSRYVMWNFCGVSSRTQVSVRVQWARVLSQLKRAPKKIRSDRGGETRLVADGHVGLMQRVLGPQITFPDVYRYGTSKKNQRIEAWWNQMSGSCLVWWREYFEELADTALWDKHNLPDRISLLAVYIPIIRAQLRNWVDQWNAHHIGAQSHRPHVVTGQPFVNFFFPEDGTEDYGVPVPQDVLEDLHSEAEVFALDAYLPGETQEYCDRRLHEINPAFSELQGEEYDPRGHPLHKEAYLCLRQGREPSRMKERLLLLMLLFVVRTFLPRRPH